MSYYEKLKKFNNRKNYLIDTNTAKLFLSYCLTTSRHREIFIIGTGLGADYRIITDFKNLKVIGIEPRSSFQGIASKTYCKFGGKLLQMNLGEFVKISKNLSGIFLFIHSINHIPKSQLDTFRKSIKKSYIIIVNPNPDIEKIVGKTDKTVISYLNSKRIKKILNCETVFDFFYNPVKIKKSEIFLREAIVLKTKK